MILKFFCKLFYFLLIVIPLISISQVTDKKESLVSKSNSLFVGLKFQKAVGFYWTNGVYSEFSSTKLMKQKISIGLGFVTSNFGSAISSNALSTFQLESSLIKYFRKGKNFSPFIRLNSGWAHVNYNNPIFDALPKNQFLLSFETGMSYDFKFPLRILLGGGYNVFYGDGSSGLGSVFPIYYQLAFVYEIFNN